MNMVRESSERHLVVEFKEKWVKEKMNKALKTSKCNALEGN